MMTIEPNKEIEMLLEWELLTENMVKLYATSIEGKLYLFLIISNTDFPHIGYEVNNGLNALEKLTAIETLKLYLSLQSKSIKTAESGQSGRAY